jgi:hypothetical protein
MKRTELILVILATTGIILKIALIPGGEALMTISLLTLSTFYLCLSFAFFNDLKIKKIFKKSSYQTLSSLKLFGSVGTGVALSTMVFGSLCKMKFWSGANLRLELGLILGLIVLVFGIIKFQETRLKYYKNILIRIFIWGFVSLSIFLFPSKTLFRIFHRNQPEYIKAVLDSWDSPNDKNLQEKVRTERAKYYDE